MSITAKSNSKMEIAAKSNSKPMYSWWWDSHNTPKNSKWLQENLADMDCNLKKMIEVLEEDADSFARRAEMYYRKRPELMQLVEEFYRAYRALAERYNHATGVIHKAHQTIAEAFPNQVPLIFGDESSHVDPQTPEMIPSHIRARCDPNEFSVKRNIDFSEEAQFAVSNGKARKGLNFNDGENGKGRDDHLEAQVVSESELRTSKAEAEVVALKDSISKMEAEREAILAQFEKNLEKLANLESEMVCKQEESRGLNHRAVIAEAEFKTLRENLEKLEADYQKCLPKIAEAGEISERANKAESETLSLKESLAKAEERLRKAEEDSRLINEQAEQAALDVENLKRTISKLIEEKEGSEIQYQQCLDIIAELKLKLYHAQEVNKKLNSEIEDGVAKLKFSEEKCLVLERSNQNLHSELDSLLEKLGNQSEKLTEKQTELVKLWSCVQEEHLHFQESETAFQTLQQLHSQSQEELNNLGLELETKSRIMKDMEIRNNELHEEIQKAKVEYKELNLSSVESVSRLKETIRKLEAEVELRVEQRSGLQREIYSLKEELSQVKKKHDSMVELVSSSVNLLQEFNERGKTEKIALFEKLEAMEKLIQENHLLEKSISDLNLELESIREKLKTLEEEELCDDESVATKEKSVLAIENIVLVESLRQLNSEAISIATEKKSLEDQLREKEKELAEEEQACKNLETRTRSESKEADIEEKLKRRSQQDIVLLNESIKSLEDYVFARRKSEAELSKDADSMDNSAREDDGFGNMCLRIKAVSEAITEKEKLLMLENTNAYSMLEEALKQIKDLKTGSSGRRSLRKVQPEGGGGGGSAMKTRKPSNHEIEMVTKDIVLDQTSDGSSYEIKRRDLELDYNHSFVELKPVKTRNTGKSLSEESLIVDKLEIFDGFMDPNQEVNEKRKVMERLGSDLRKLENLQITVKDLRSKSDEYETIKGQLEEAEESIEKLFNVNRKLTTKAESSEKEISVERRRRITEQARRGSEKIGRLQLELQRIQFLLVRLEGEKRDKEKKKDDRFNKVSISDSKFSKVLLRDYIYGVGTRSVSMKKKMMKTKKRSAFCGCVQQQQPRSP